MIVTDSKIDELLNTLTDELISLRKFGGDNSRNGCREFVRTWLDSLPRDIHDHRNFRLPTGKP